MYGHILVALDGSEVAEQVLPHVEALAEKFGSAITILRAITPPIALVTPGPSGLPVTSYDPEIYQTTLEAEREEGTDYLHSIAERLRNLGLSIDEVLVEDPPADAIVERTSTLGVDLVAMTTHGRGGLRRLVLGSVADEVVRRVACPVLLVRAV